MANDVDIVIGAQDKASKVLDSVAGKVGGFSASIAALGPAGIAAGAAMAAAGASVAIFAKTVADAAAAIDVSSEESAESLSKISEIIKTIGAGGNGAGAAVFKQLGLDAQELSLQEPIDQFMAVKAALAEIESGSERAATAQKLFGEQAAKAFGSGLTDQQVAAVRSMNDAMGEVGAKFDALINQVVVAMAPAIEEIANELANWVGPAADLAEQYLPQVMDAAAATAGYMADIAAIIGRLRIGDVLGAAEIAKEMKTATEWVDRLAEARARAAQRAIEDAEAQRQAREKTEADKITTANAAAEQKAADAIANTIAQLERQVAVAQQGEDAIKRQEDLAKARDDSERQRINALYDQLAAIEAQNDAMAAQAEFQKKLDDAMAKAEEERLKEQQDMQQKLSQSTSGVKAVEGRLLTRGPGGDTSAQTLAAAKKSNELQAEANKKLEQIYQEARQRGVPLQVAIIN